MRLRRLLTTIFFACLGLATATPAAAANESIVASQTADGTVLITLRGTSNCVGGNTPIGSSVTSINGSTIAVQSNFANPGPPCVFSPTPVPYSTTVDAGHLPNGNYAVTWTFALTPPVPPSPFATFSAIVTVPTGNATDPEQVPTLSPWALAVLSLAFAAVAVTMKGPSSRGVG